MAAMSATTLAMVRPSSGVTPYSNPCSARVTAIHHSTACTTLKIAAFTPMPSVGLDGYVVRVRLCGPLLALADVEKIYYAAGAPLASVSVAEGWAQELIQTGKITRGTTTVLNTETGDWSEKASKKMKYNKGHNTHIHIALDPKKLLQWPEQ